MMRDSDMTSMGRQTPFSRRDALHQMGAGFGSVSLAPLLARSESAMAANAAMTSPLAPKQVHFPTKAKSVIQLFMPGGPSQVDTFDYKPELVKYA
ncbi:MAG: DUF1501 domain-containing protein, partial [Planctomycetaceae bacterium]|nr:DUF1501 domain-containing protein [Planctomycetaceae bacterium]